MSGLERRSQVLEITAGEFANHGLNGASLLLALGLLFEGLVEFLELGVGGADGLGGHAGEQPAVGLGLHQMRATVYWAEGEAVAAAEQEDEPLQAGAQLGDAVGQVADELFQEAGRWPRPRASHSLRNCNISASSAASAASSFTLGMRSQSRENSGRRPPMTTARRTGQTLDRKHGPCSASTTHAIPRSTRTPTRSSAW